LHAELLEKHLQLQKKEVWIEGLGTAQRGIFQDSYKPLPLTLTVKGKALPFVSVCLIMSGRYACDVKLCLSGHSHRAIQLQPAYADLV